MSRACLIVVAKLLFLTVVTWSEVHAAFVASKPNVGYTSRHVTTTSTSSQQHLVSRPLLGSDVRRPPPSSSTSTQLNLQPVDSFSHIVHMSTWSNSMWLATVDSDIAKLSENEFAPVFMGGVVVMLGGVVSALLVGFIVEKRDLYATLVADSYAQGNIEEEEFWKGLSEEEKRKAQEALQRFQLSEDKKQQPQDGVPSVLSTTKVDVPKESTTTTTTTTVTRVIVEPEATTPTATTATQMGNAKKNLDMFSDYDA